jgi:hypothetical protein
MRAKEKLEFNRKEFDYYEQVKKSIDDLHPVRSNKRKTKDYFNNHLFADARYRKMLKSSNSTHDRVRFRHKKDEIDHSIAYRVRQEIKNAVNDDLSFLYAYNIIERDHNPYDEDQKGNTVNLKPETLNSSDEIEKECIRYKEDYPKNNLADFLVDPDNLFYFGAHSEEISRDEEWWLSAFNIAYELFDRVRIKALEPFKVQYMVKNIYYNDVQLEETVVGIVHNLLLNYSYDLSDEQKLKFELLKNQIEDYWDNQYYETDDQQVMEVDSQNLEKVNWKKLTKYFNYQIITNWVTHPAFQSEQQLLILNNIEKKYLIEKQEHPSFYHYDLTCFFTCLRDHFQIKDNITDSTNYPDLQQKSSMRRLSMNQTIAVQRTVIEELKSSIEKLAETATQKNEEIKMIATKHSEEIESLKMIIREQAEEYNTRKGMSMPQFVLFVKYIAYELGKNYRNTPKAHFGRLVERMTGCNSQNIKNEFDIKYDSRRTKNNLRIVAEALTELFPDIANRMLNDIK